MKLARFTTSLILVLAGCLSPVFNIDWRRRQLGDRVQLALMGEVSRFARKAKGTVDASDPARRRRPSASEQGLLDVWP